MLHDYTSILSTTEGNLSCFQYLAITNNCYMNILAHTHMNVLLLSIYLEVEFWGHVVCDIVK